ncbi:uncharacterized protein LOC116667582 isoform X1 [Camelus ferus]|uniref:Uncharacterized protein LOC116667582 isoform X1 n=2 Tax=Camelus ferus TaxID=419612 RepID=A0A8B8U2L4_CAMFR|nr:uncharacterized protein LOC116667582 isoform X1 [Camelus ferus]
MATSSSSTMATPTAAPATRLRRLSRDAARASKSSSLLGAMAAEARSSPRTPEAVAGLGPGSGSPRRLLPAPPPLRAPASVLRFPKPSVKAEVPASRMPALRTAAFSRMAAPKSPATQTDRSLPELGLLSALWTSQALRCEWRPPDTTSCSSLQLMKCGERPHRELSDPSFLRWDIGSRAETDRDSTAVGPAIHPVRRQLGGQTKSSFGWMRVPADRKCEGSALPPAAHPAPSPHNRRPPVTQPAARGAPGPGLGEGGGGTAT